MASVSVLARLTGGTRWREPDHISGGIPQLTNEEIRGALGGLSRLEMRLALVMWCREDSEWPALERSALIGAAALPRVQAWRGKHPAGLLRAFIAAALVEVTQPPVCRTCRGVGSVRYLTDSHGKRLNAVEAAAHKRERKPTTERVIACRVCEGAGWKRETDAELAQVASIYYPMSRATWNRLSREYGYEVIYGWLKARADAVERHIRIQLRS